MGKATRLKQQSAREKIAAQRAAAKRAERRRMMLLTGGSTFGVIAIVLVLILVYTLNKPTASTGSSTGKALPATLISQVTHVPTSTLTTVGGGAANLAGQFHSITGEPPLTSGGKPEMLYIGGEFCPYCAAMRWSMAVALSRFGTFTTPIHGIRSDSSDVFASTATLTFYKTNYTSKYLVFTPVEAENIQQKALQQPTSAQTALWDKVDTEAGVQAGSFPFIDVGNKYYFGVIYSPAALGSNPGRGIGQSKDWSEIAASLKTASNPIAQNVDGAANYLTAAICKMTNNQPSSVCSSSAITALQGKLG